MTTPKGIPPRTLTVDVRQEHIDRLEMIAQDMESDARDFDGKPFNGKTVAEYLGNHGAAISALAVIIREILLNPEAGE